MKVSILTHIKKCQFTGNDVLIQDRVLEILETDDFDEIRELMLDVLPYWKPQSNKYETYSWLPAECSFVTKTHEDGSEHTYRRRSANTCADEVCVLILDIDNELHDKKRNLSYRYVHTANSPVLSENANYDPELWEFCAGKAVLSLSDIKERLAQLHINHFWYTSYSHTNEKAKVRVVLELSRPITWDEAWKLGAIVSFEHFECQADPSIYGKGDHVYAPPHKGLSGYAYPGNTLDVDDVLKRWQPGSMAARLFKDDGGGVEKIKITKEQEASYSQTLIQNQPSSIDLSLKNKKLWSQSWNANYQTPYVNNSHHDSMVRLLAAVLHRAVANNITLSLADLTALVYQIDALAGSYIQSKRGRHEIDSIAKHVHKMLAALLFKQDGTVKSPSELKRDAKKVIAHIDFGDKVHKDTSSIVVNVIDAPCGSGKTFWMLKRIAEGGGRWIYACDKVKNIRQRVAEFKEATAIVLNESNLTNEDRWKDWTVEAKFAPQEANDDDVISVCQEIKDTMDYTLSLDLKNVVIFITHKALEMMKWNNVWEKWNLVIDEISDPQINLQLDFRNHADTIERFLAASETSDEVLELSLTAAGRAFLEQDVIDAVDKNYKGVCELVSDPGRRVWVTAKSWTNKTTERLDIFSLFSPESVKDFKDLYLLGDEAYSSLLVRSWKQVFQVGFRDVMHFEPRARAKPVGERVKLFYFSEQDGSFYRFEKRADSPIAQIGRWFAANDESMRETLWTTNERLKEHFGRMPNFIYETPKAHGLNQYQHIDRVVFLAAMKMATQEYKQFEQWLGMTRDELIRWREQNAIYQFVMRSNLRDYDSDDVCDVFVFSRAQADYLKERLGCGDADLVYVEGVVAETGKPVGRPAKVGTAMTEAQRKQKSRLMAKGMTEAEALREVMGDGASEGGDGQDDGGDPGEVGQGEPVAIGASPRDGESAQRTEVLESHRAGQPGRFAQIRQRLAQRK